jgi:eukaryotic-like serine/threonine-protein kinase
MVTELLEGETLRERLRSSLLPARKATEFETVGLQTEPGMLIGTVGYMSPEQVKGQAADHRSDLFSFGAILYEMLVGKRAFDGGTAVEAMNAILKEDPPESTGTNRSVPLLLDRIVYRCLEKNPEERFQSAHDVAFALGAVSDSSKSAVAGVTVRLPRLALPDARGTSCLPAGKALTFTTT